MTKRVVLSALAAALFLVQFGPAASAASGPGYTVPKRQLAAALKCHGPITDGGRQPVLLLPAAQRTPHANWDGGYVQALAQTGRVACTVPLVLNGAGDIQDSAEYVVYAVRDLARRSGRRIAIV